MRETMKAGSKTLGPRRKGRTFGGDIMRGEGGIPADWFGPGKRTRSKKADAIPGGGGPNSAHRKFSQKQSERQEARRQTASLKGGLTHGTTLHPYDGTDPDTVASGSGTSIFDPVLCELVYRWFCPPGGLVLDPFAGGSVRGIVASKLGRAYLGIDLSERQVAANAAQARAICKEAPVPEWRVGDSRDLAKLVDKAVRADFIFSCPPYADLEVYSDDPRDLSTMPYAEFRKGYEAIIKAACDRLRPNRFACFVVGDARDAKGFYYGFPWHTVAAFEAAGLRLYNEAVLVTACGSLPIRVTKQFQGGRKLGKTHQNLLLFCKGDPALATKAVGPVEFGDIEALAAADAVIPKLQLGGEI